MKKWLIIMLLVSPALYAMEVDMQDVEAVEESVTLLNNTQMNAEAFHAVYEQLDTFFQEADQDDIYTLYLCAIGEATIQDLSQDTCQNYAQTLFDAVGNMKPEVCQVLSIACTNLQNQNNEAIELKSIEQICANYPQAWNAQNSDDEASVSSSDSDSDEANSSDEEFVTTHPADQGEVTSDDDAMSEAEYQNSDDETPADHVYVDSSDDEEALVSVAPTSKMQVKTRSTNNDDALYYLVDSEDSDNDEMAEAEYNTEDTLVPPFMGIAVR